MSYAGRQVIAVARTCKLIFIVLDVLKPLGDKAIIEKELEGKLLNVIVSDSFLLLSIFIIKAILYADRPK